MFNHPNTTIFGILTIAAACVNIGIAIFDSNPATTPDWPLTFAAITAGIAAIKAADAKKAP